MFKHALLRSILIGAASLAALLTLVAYTGVQPATAAGNTNNAPPMSLNVMSSQEQTVGRATPLTDTMPMTGTMMDSGDMAAMMKMMASMMPMTGTRLMMDMMPMTDTTR
jgi:hypothetical protein